MAEQTSGASAASVGGGRRSAEQAAGPVSVAQRVRAAGSGLAGRWARSGLGRDALMLLGVLLVTFALLGIVFDRTFLMRRVDVFTSMFSAQIGALSRAVQQMPPGEREPFVAALEEASEGGLRRSVPPASGFAEQAGVSGRSLQRLREKVPDQTIGWTNDPSPRMWLALAGKDEAARVWVFMPQPLRPEPVAEAFIGSALALVAVCLVGAALLVRRLRRSLPDDQAHSGADPDSQGLEAARHSLDLLQRPPPAHDRGAAAAGESFRHLVTQVEELARSTTLRRAAEPAADRQGWRQAGRFAGDAALVFALMCSAIVVVLVVIEQAIVMPRSSYGAAVFTQQIRLITRSVGLLPPQRVESYLRDVEHFSYGYMERADLSGLEFAEPSLRATARFVAEVRGGLPDVPVRVTMEPHRALWFALPAAPGAEGTVWIRYLSPPLLEVLRDVVAGMLLLALVGSLLIVWRAHARIRDAQLALRRVEADGPASEWRVPVDEAQDHRPPALHPVVHDSLLRQERHQSQRALAAAAFAQELRAAIAAWRERRPDGVEAEAAQQGLAAMERALAELDEFERAAGTQRELIDVNELLAVLPLGGSEAELHLDGVPYVSMQRAQAWRVFEAMVAHVQAGSRARIAIGSALERGRVLVRVAAVGGARGDAHPQPARDAQEAAALGLEVARRIVQAHGGVLRASEPGGLAWVEAWLPPARLS